MRYLHAWFSVVCGLTVSAQAIGNSQHFSKNQALNGFIAPSGLNGDTHARSLQDCGSACVSHSNCTSFFYVFETSICRMQDITHTQTTGLLSVNSSVYFVTEIEAATPFQCPPDDSIFRTVLLSDSTTVQYRAFRTAKIHQDAMLECTNLGGRLLQVLTEARNSFAVNLLMCTGYDVGNYWIDGSNADAAVFTDLSGWKTSDGIVLPTQFWDASQPNAPQNDHCLGMYMAYNWAWADRPCGTPHNYICEIP